MANLMKRQGWLPQLWICLAIYTSVVLAHGAPVALLGGDSDECRCSESDPLLYIAGGKWAGPYGRAVVEEWRNDAIQDYEQLNMKLEQEMSEMQRKLTQSENELKTAKLKWAGEKYHLEVSFKKKELLLRDKLGKERDQYKAHWASCQSRQQDMVTVEACDIKTHEALTECNENHQKWVAALDNNIGVGGSSRDLETRPSSCFQNVSREQELGRCRSEKIHARAILASQTKGQDAERFHVLRSLVVPVAMCLVLGTVVWLISAVNVRNENSSPSTQTQVLSSEDVQRTLVSMFETEGKVSSILTSPVASGSGGTDYMFLLVPVNVTSSRNLALFGGGGCYTRQVEVAQDCARKEGKSLFIVLYRCGGHAFTARDMATFGRDLISKTAPKDLDFPRERDILVLWTRGSDDLQVTESGGNSELSEIVKRQPWARHLGRCS